MMISKLKKVLTTNFCVFALMLGVCLSGSVYAQVSSSAVVGLPDFASLVEKTGPAVVNIRTTEKMQPTSRMMGSDEEMLQFFHRFFGMPLPGPNQQHPKKAPRQPEQEVPRGVGSGFIISSDGFILTNAHVVDGADEVYVKLTDDREFKAKVIGSDKLTDVALLKIDGKNLPVLKLGDSSKIKVGQWVIAIGSPFDLDNTVTAGIVSAKSRDTGEYLPLIQTDVAVNPGNSGGPLINMEGQVVGINSQIYSRSGGYMGISFAVPINEAMRIADQIKATGKVVRGRIGVQISGVTREVAESLGLARPEGGLVNRVEPGSPAEKGGVEAGDIIIKLNGAPIKNAFDLPRIVGSIKPGTKIVLSVLRRGKNYELTINVAELTVPKRASLDGKKQNPHADNLGLVVSDLDQNGNKLENGVRIESASGVAARAGLQSNDIVLQLGNVDIKDSKQFNELVEKLDVKKPVALLVQRGDLAQFVPIRPQS